MLVSVKVLLRLYKIEPGSSALAFEVTRRQQDIWMVGEGPTHDDNMRHWAEETRKPCWVGRGVTRLYGQEAPPPRADVLCDTPVIELCYGRWWLCGPRPRFWNKNGGFVWRSVHLLIVLRLNNVCGYLWNCLVWLMLCLHCTFFSSVVVTVVLAPQPSKYRMSCTSSTSNNITITIRIIIISVVVVVVGINRLVYGFHLAVWGWAKFSGWPLHYIHILQK